jgi:PAS domain S-box-containing protein
MIDRGAPEDTTAPVPPLGAVLEAAPDAMLIVDGEGRISHVNSQVEALFGYARGELVDRNLEILLPERFRAAHPGHRLRYLSEPRNRLMGKAGVELHGRRKDGAEFPAEVSLSPLRWEGRLLIIAAVRDVTTRRKVESRFRRLMDAAPDALVLSNGAGRIVLVNELAEALFGYGRGEMLGQPVEMLIPARHRGADGQQPGSYFTRQRQRPVAEGGVELYGLRRDGSEFPAEISLSPLDSEGEDEPIAIAAIRDITERLKAEAERTKLVQAQEAIRLRDEFLSVASHELRTPLTPIQLQIDGALRAARRSGEPDLPTVIRKLDALGNGIHRLSTLVNQLLDLSRITAGRLDLERASVDLVALVGRAMTAFEDEAVLNECELEFEAPRSEIRGRWDASRLEQVVINLLSNALRYGTGRPVALSLVESRPGWVMLLVRDQGIGIAHEHQALVFQRFERLSESRHRGGFGLGLWIVRQIVDAHGGTIGVFSRPGLGATFAVELPTGLPPVVGSRKVVLLVDDDQATRQAFRQTAGNDRYRPLTAGHGADALGLLHFGVRPSLILLDDDMPLMDGATTAAELRANPAWADIPVVWLTGRGCPSDARNGNDAGPTLAKPFSPHELQGVIARHCPDL